MEYLLWIAVLYLNYCKIFLIVFKYCTEQLMKGHEKKELKATVPILVENAVEIILIRNSTSNLDFDSTVFWLLQDFIINNPLSVKLMPYLNLSYDF